MTISFRRASESDADTLIPYIRKLHAQDHITVDESIVRTALNGLIVDESKGGVWVILDGAIPVGYAVLTYGYSLEFHGRDALLDELFIEEGYRGRGFGRQAMGFLMSACEKAGAHALHLEVDRSFISLVARTYARSARDSPPCS
jgi:GNAT superfamily N-acetyltransferase